MVTVMLEWKYGTLPTSWELSTIGDYSNTITDYVANGSFASLAQNVQYKEEPDVAVLIRLVDYNNNFKGDFVYIDEHAYEFLSKSKLYGGEIIISNVGANVGTVFRCPTLTLKMSLAPNSIMLRTKGIDDFYYYWFKSPVGQHAIASIVTGSAQPKFNKTTFKKIVVPVPPIETQRKIALCLKTIDEKIECNKSINDNLQQQAAAIFRSWFVDCAPFGGKAPDEWKNVTLEDITALISRGITPKYADDTDQIVINQKCIRNHTIDLSLARTHTPKVINEKWLRFGDLLINSTGDGTLGRAAQVWFQPKNLTVDSHVTIARPAKENLIFYIGLWGILHEKEIESLHTGSTGQTELPRDRVKAMELRLPDNDTLDRFNALITPMAAAIVANQEENNRLAALRDAILPKLMSGEIDVSAVQL